VPKSILTTPAWKLFLAFLVGMLAAELVALYLARYLNWNMNYGPYQTLRFGLITLILWTYPYLVGRALSQRAGIRTAHRQVLWIVLIALVNNVFSVYYTETYGPGWLALLITAVVNIFCLLAVYSFPARELKSIELNRRARFVECLREILQFLFWPVAVWWLQPTLTYIVIEQEVLKKERS
jgi:hypothetical protein